jgi:hypothetical protein
MNGNFDEVARLMETVRHIGKKHAAGGGEVAEFKVSRIENDYSLTKDGLAMRSLPVEMLKSYDSGGAMLMAYQAPYWDQKNVALCVAPGCRCEL